MRYCYYMLNWTTGQTNGEQRERERENGKNFPGAEYWSTKVNLVQQVCFYTASKYTYIVQRDFSCWKIFFSILSHCLHMLMHLDPWPADRLVSLAATPSFLPSFLPLSWQEDTTKIRRRRGRRDRMGGGKKLVLALLFILRILLLTDTVCLSVCLSVCLVLSCLVLSCFRQLFIQLCCAVHSLPA